jgi:hypothetical protein
MTTTCIRRRATARLVHLAGAAHAHDLAHRPARRARSAGDEDHLGAAPRRFGGNRVAHAAARSVADVAHRIESS